MKLILIHGRSQQFKEPATLAAEWKNAIAAGYQSAGLQWTGSAEIVFPFYGDDLDRLVHRMDSPLLTDILLRGDRPAFYEDEGRTEILEEIAAEWRDSQKGVQELPEDDLQQSTLSPVRGPQNWQSLQAILRALDRTPLGGRLVDAITRDVWIYLTYSGIQNKVNAIVDEMISEERCVIVAHSLGTIVAYNVLSKRGASAPEVPLFLTLGSPLGIRAISTRLRVPLAIPPGVARWINARDPRDVVALHPLDVEHFNVDPVIENFSRVDNFSENRHSIEGYLADPFVVRCLHENL